MITLGVTSPTKVVPKKKAKKRVAIEAPVDEIFIGSDKSSPDTTRQIRNRSRSSPHGPQPALRSTTTTTAATNSTINRIVVDVPSESASAGLEDGARSPPENSCYDSDSGSAPATTKPSTALARLRVLLAEQAPSEAAAEDAADLISAVERGLAGTARKNERIARLTERVAARTEKISVLTEASKISAQQISDLNGHVARLEQEAAEHSAAMTDMQKKLADMQALLDARDKELAEARAQVNAKEVAVAELNVELMKAKDAAEQARREGAAAVDRVERQARMREDVVVDFERIDRLLAALCKCARVFDQNTPAKPPKRDVTDEDIRTTSKLLDRKVDDGIDLAEKVNRLCVDRKVALNKKEAEVMANVRENDVLRERYYYALAVSVKQYLSINLVSPCFRDLDELYNELKREELPVRDWPKWISDNILVTKKVIVRKTTVKK